MAFENPEKFGDVNFTEKQAYEMQKGINKMLWETNNNKDVPEKQNLEKKSNFC